MYEVIPVSQSINKDILEAQIKSEFERALSNLINRVTPPEDFPGGKLPKRPVRGGGTQLDFVPGWWFVREANALFQHRWSFLVDEHGIETNHVWVKGHVEVFVPGDGTHEGYTIRKSQFGGGAIKRKSDGTKAVIDIGDDLKAAATDCMKKCLTQFGIAADIYGPREQKEHGAPDSEQITILYKVGEEAGMSIEEVIDQCKADNEDRKPEECKEIEVLVLVNKLRKKVKSDS